MFGVPKICVDLVLPALPTRAHNICKHLHVYVPDELDPLWELMQEEEYLTLSQDRGQGHMAVHLALPIL